ncbi:hypothetical protein HYT58_02845 [Candidatus Woesearchaeota archaeon]|nr:hypothetical protein [Candidatus Woesearchaeota archaeon]
MTVPAIIRDYELVNLSEEDPDIKIDETGLKKLIILPNYRPNDERGVLPNGVVAVYSSDSVPNPRMLGNAVGCGIAMVKFESPANFSEDTVDRIRRKLKASESRACLYGETDFIAFYNISTLIPQFEQGGLVAIIHSGCNPVSKVLSEEGILSRDSIKAWERDVNYGKEERSFLTGVLCGISEGAVTGFIDSAHTSIERVNSQIVYRKGAFNVDYLDYSVICNPADKSVLLIRVRDSITEIGNSLPFIDQGDSEMTGGFISEVAGFRRYFDVVGKLKNLATISSDDLK